ncbi:MAG: response regulator [Alphaproteobacteria bacterium]
MHSDPRLLEQMMRNLLSNAMKYTRNGKVLLGCRRHSTTLSIEVLDTGIGIAESDLKAIFEEYHQVDNEARERSRGLGLGLAIVQRLGNLLGHELRVRSLPGKGSVFTIDVAMATEGTVLPRRGEAPDEAVPEKIARTATILVIEDDPDVRELLELLLKSEGYRAILAEDGAAALALPMHAADRPDLILADFNLPGGLNGIEVATALREKINKNIPAIVLTGDISIAALKEISRHNCLYASKPVKARELSKSVAALLAGDSGAEQSEPVSTRPPVASDAPIVPVPARPPVASDAPIIHVVDDDSDVCDAIRSVLELAGQTVEIYSSSEDFLSAYKPGGDACLLIDILLPGMQGIDLLQKLRTESNNVPAIVITGNGDVATAVRAMKAGAQDFIEKPISGEELLASIERARGMHRGTAAASVWREKAARKIIGLTSRQRQIMDLVLAGHPNKNIAADLGISQRTVENHRAAVMKRTGARSLPALARMAVAASGHPDDESSSGA